MMESDGLFKILKAGRSGIDKIKDAKLRQPIDYPLTRWYELLCFFLAGVLWFLSAIALLSLMV